MLIIIVLLVVLVVWNMWTTTAASVFCIWLLFIYGLCPPLLKVIIALQSLHSSLVHILLITLLSSWLLKLATSTHPHFVTSIIASFKLTNHFWVWVTQFTHWSCSVLSYLSRMLKSYTWISQIVILVVWVRIIVEGVMALWFILASFFLKYFTWLHRWTLLGMQLRWLRGAARNIATTHLLLLLLLCLILLVLLFVLILLCRHFQKLIHKTGRHLALQMRITHFRVWL